MNESCRVIARLTDKDAVSACAFADKITAESRESSVWYEYIDAYEELLEHKNSLVRNRAIAIIAANARWDSDNRYDKIADRLLPHITDEKPITARQCIKSLPEIARAKPRLIPRMRAALERADIAGYKDSMQPLIMKDIIAALRQMEEIENEERNAENK